MRVKTRVPFLRRISDLYKVYLKVLMGR